MFKYILTYILSTIFIYMHKIYQFTNHINLIIYIYKIIVLIVYIQYYLIIYNIEILKYVIVTL